MMVAVDRSVLVMRSIVLFPFFGICFHIRVELIGSSVVGSAYRVYGLTLSTYNEYYMLLLLLFRGF